MAGRIRTCDTWQDRHDRPVYTLETQCPACGGSTRPAAPARYTPGDPYGSYRRATRRSQGDTWSR